MQDPVLKIRIILSMRMEYLVVLMMLSVMTLALLQNVDEWFTFILKNLRAYPGTVRGTEEWNKTYKLIIFSIIHSCLIGFLGKTF